MKENGTVLKTDKNTEQVERCGISFILFRLVITMCLQTITL
jgi:hypothetical protein